MSGDIIPLPPTPKIDPDGQNALFLQWSGDCLTHINGSLDEVKTSLASVIARLDLYDEERADELQAAKTKRLLIEAEDAIRQKRLGRLSALWQTFKELSSTGLIVAGASAVVTLLWKIVAG